MGRLNSSKTRVIPVFDELSARDPSGASWLQKLLDLPELPGQSRTVTRWQNCAPLKAWGWGDEEIGLSAPPGLLRWLLENAMTPPLKDAWGSATVKAKREALLVRKEAQALEEARRLLSTYRGRGSAWWLFEGLSFPDVYLETESVLVVIEGKRTEPGPTLRTTWMDPRPQMVRHLDCAFERRDGLAIAGFFIVEGSGDGEDVAVPRKWVTAAQETILPQVLAASLPHRTPVERQAIAEAFLGVTTWQRLCQVFRLPWPPCPDRG